MSADRAGPEPTAALSGPSKVTLTAAQRQQIFDHCLAERPNEACGLAVGRAGRVERLYFTRNVEQQDKRIRYEIDPNDLLRVFKEIDDDDLELIGIFHSHVQSAAYPSATDIRLSYYPDAVYFLVSLRDEPILRAFRIVKREPTDETGEVVSLDLILEGPA